LNSDRDTAFHSNPDTGSNGITPLNVCCGKVDRRSPAIERGTRHTEWTGADYNTLIDGGKIEGMSMPSGIALVDNNLLVTDNESSTIFRFSLTGQLLESITLDIEEGGLMGIEARAIDDIWVVDAEDDRVLHLSAE